jgi:hypothetical protein
MAEICHLFVCNKRSDMQQLTNISGEQLNVRTVAFLDVVEITNTMHWFVPLLYSV